MYNYINVYVMSLLQYNPDLIFEDINFPLRKKYDQIKDNADHLIVTISDEELAKKLTGKYKEVEYVDDIVEADSDGNLFYKENGVKLGKINCWSRVLGKDESSYRAQNFIDYIVNRINQK